MTNSYLFDLIFFFNESWDFTPPKKVALELGARARARKILLKVQKPSFFLSSTVFFPPSEKGRKVNCVDGSSLWFFTLLIKFHHVEELNQWFNFWKFSFKFSINVQKTTIPHQTNKHHFIQSSHSDTENVCCFISLNKEYLGVLKQIGGTSAPSEFARR